MRYLTTNGDTGQFFQCHECNEIQKYLEIIADTIYVLDSIAIYILV